MKIMSRQKIFIVLALMIIFILGFVAMGQNREISEQEDIKFIEEKSEIPAKIPEKSGENLADNFKEFNRLILMTVNNPITFPDGLSVLLKEINDSRCPQGVQCIWAGELSGIFTLSGGNFTASKEINLGAINNKKIILEGYTFSLHNITENSATILVENRK